MHMKSMNIFFRDVNLNIILDKSFYTEYFPLFTLFDYEKAKYVV